MCVCACARVWEGRRERRKRKTGESPSFRDLTYANVSLQRAPLSLPDYRWPQQSWFRGVTPEAPSESQAINFCSSSTTGNISLSLECRLCVCVCVCVCVCTRACVRTSASASVCRVPAHAMANRSPTRAQKKQDENRNCCKYQHSLPLPAQRDCRGWPGSGQHTRRYHTAGPPAVTDVAELTRSACRLQPPVSCSSSRAHALL